MSTLDAPVQQPSAAEQATALEIAINVRLEGLLERAELLRDRALAEADAHTVARAELLIADRHGRVGDLNRAIELQRTMLERARAEGQATIEGRTQFYLASNWDRIGLRTESLEAANEGVRLLDETCPAHWHVEHHMVLAMLTNYDRAGATDLELMEDSLRRARALGDPDVLLLVLNNFAWTAHQCEAGRPRAYELMDEMTTLVAEGRAIPSAADLDTMGWLRLANGEVEEAERLLELGLTHTDHVEPDSAAALRIHLAAVRRRQGRLDAAAHLLQHGRSEAMATKTPEFALEALDALAEIDAERGDYRRAYRRLRRLIEERATFEREESERRAAVLQSIYATQNERDQRRYYQELSVRDPLTGMYNRRHLEDRLGELVGTCELALAMLDIDHFKRVNDEHSHSTGDCILRELATILAGHARQMSPDGFAVRLGGEEFVIVAPGVTAAQASASLSQLRRHVAAHRWNGVPSTIAPTISIGLATSSPGGSDTRATLLARSDELLYRAKRAGRNRVVSDDGPAVVACALGTGGRATQFIVELKFGLWCDGFVMEPAAAEPTSPAHRVDIAVVGAGLAGLTAARELSRAGRSVVVLEARPRVGGRTLNHDIGDGAVVEAGGAYVGPTQVHVLALARELGIDTFPAGIPGDQVFVHGRRVKRYHGNVPPDLLALPGLGIAMARVNQLCRQIPLEAPWDHPKAHAWDSITFESWLRRTTTGLGPGALEWFNVFLSSAFGAEARDVSLLFSLWYIAMMGDESHPGNLDRGIAMEGGAQESRLVGGSQLISLKLAEELGERVVLDAPVRRIEQDGSARVHCDAGTWTADRVIVAVPPQLACEIAWDPALPPAQDALLRRLPFGTLMKCDAVYDTPFWREEGLCGMAVLRDGTPIRSIFDKTPPGGNPGVLMGFLGGEDWRLWAPVSPEARRRAVLQCFARAFGPRALEARDYFETDWVSETWSRGGPTSIPGPGTLIDFGHSRAVPHGRVHWAGTETARHWNGFMDGAVSSGRRAAREVEQVL